MFDTLTRMGASAAGAYEIEKSCRFDFDSSTYMERTVSSASNRRTNTISVWLKRSQLGNKSGDDAQSIYGSGGGGGGSSATMLYILTDGRIGILTMIGSIHGHLVTTAVFRDPAQWYHVVAVYDTENGTSGDRLRLYVNGVRITDFGTETYPSQDQDTYLHYNDKHGVGANRVWADQSQIYNYYGGYMAELHVVDGSALTPSSFGETNATTGQWIPIEYTGSHGTNGFYMDFSNASSLGDDAAGSNDYTESGFATNDSFTDTPTNNYATFNPVFKVDAVPNSRTISNGSLAVSGATNNSGDAIHAASIPFPLTGKWYIEVDVTTLGTAGGNEGGPLIGITDIPGPDLNSKSKMIRADGKVATTGNAGGAGNSQFSTTFAANIAQGDVWQLAYDADNRYVYFGKSNSWADGSGNYDESTFTDAQAHATQPTAGVPQLFILSAPYSSATAISYQFDINFGQRAFAHTPPTGYQTLCTANLPEPTILKGSDHFNTITYTGDGNQTRTLAGVGFQPDLIWSRIRTGTTQGIGVFDAVRTFASDKALDTSANTSEGTWNGANSSEYGYVSSVNSDGFVINDGTTSTNGGYINYSGRTYVAWNWKEAATAGFDIVSYTGNGTSGNTVSHSLGVAPDVIMVKARNQDGGWSGTWQVYHSALGAEKFVEISDTWQIQDSTARWNDTAPSSSVFTLGDNSNVNGNTYTYIAYLWSSVEGYSKFGSYTGNGNADGTFIYTGFKPALVIAKRTDSTGYWRILDNERDPYNVAYKASFANATDVENPTAGSSSYDTDFYSNGFKLRTTLTSSNANGGAFIYMAFAEMPFKYANAR
jgi:hypothetical protein